MQLNADPVQNTINATLAHVRAHGGYPPSALVLYHEQITNLALPSVIQYFQGLGYQFITMDECRERCIDRAYPGQPAHLADHRGCWDPYNPSDYAAAQLFLGQWWLKDVPMSTQPIPPPLGPTYPYMSLPAAPYVAPTILPGGLAGVNETQATYAPPTTAVPTTVGPTATMRPTTHVPTTKPTSTPTTTQPPPTTSPTAAATTAVCTAQGRTLTVLAGPYV